MPTTISIIHILAVFVGLIMGPSILMASHLYMRRFRGVLISWKRPQLVFFTIITFILNLTLFILASFFFAGYYGNVGKLSLLSIPIDKMNILSIDCCLLMFGVTLGYLGLKRVYIQIITQEGIYMSPFPPNPMRMKRNIIYWEQVVDYYIKSDSYPITNYNFIIQDTEYTFIRYTLKVPFEALKRFDIILESALEKQKQIKKSEKIQKKTFNN